MAVPKKRTSMSKKRIRRNILKKKGYLAGVKAFSLAKSVSTGHSKSFFVRQQAIKPRSESTWLKEF
uniref:Large ribosomal subunit protein bL32c n=1 Tax=Pentastemona sumatrana TaxID=167571 RepID=A0A0K0VIS0_9LILI|nr:ribosomal protein L32 [Pentastemona sumatrana]